MGEIVGLGAVGGVFIAFATILGYLLNANHRDRGQYEAAIDKAEARADAADARTEMERQRTRDVRAVLEEARKARYAAEETVAELRAELRRYTGTAL